MKVTTTTTSVTSSYTSAAGWIDYDPHHLLFCAEELPIQDASLRQVWGSRLTLVVFTAYDLAKQAGWKLRFRREPSGGVDSSDQDAKENGNQSGQRDEQGETPGTKKTRHTFRVRVRQIVLNHNALQR